MSNVLAPRSWVFWWAALTATVFLRDALTWLSSIFRNKSVFAPTIPPFSLVAGVNGIIDGVAEWIRTGVQFKPNDLLLAFGPLGIRNWMIALFIGLVILIIAALVYRRALGTSALLDDIAALIVLYFVIRIEAHLLAIAQLPALSQTAKSLVGNQILSFIVLLALLAGLTITGEGLKDARSFWRGVIELFLVAILLFPVEAAGAVAAFFDLIRTFGNLVMSNMLFAAIWAAFGIALALRRLYYVDARA
ncbi:MAG: hypothetical protein ACM3JD_06585 [Rudaea sp.]